YAIERGEQHPELLDADAGIERVHGQVLVSHSALLLPVEELHTLHAAEGLEEVGLLPGCTNDLVFGGFPQRPVPDHSQRAIERGLCKKYRAHLQSEVITPPRRDYRHDAIEDDLKEGGGHGPPNRVQRFEARDDVPEVPPVEVDHGHPQEV